MKRAKVLTYSFLIAILLPGFSSLRAQEMDYRMAFTDAEYYFLFNDFQEALPLYKKAYEQRPDNANLSYRIGLCYLNISGQKQNAISYLEEAVKNVTSTYQEGSYKEERAPINAYFYLGEAYRITEKIDKAIEAYNTFRDLLDTKDVYNLDYVDQQIKACNRALKMIEEPVSIDLELIKLFESEKFIFNQIVTIDKKTMAFTTQEKFYDAIYISNKDEDEQWGAPINITLDLNVEGEVFTTSFSPDGETIYLFKNDRGTGNIYTSNFVDGRWQPAQKLGKKISSRNWEIHASVSPDGKTLFFSSNRKGGYGGLDIYYSKLLPNGEWDNPKNIGSTINTPHNEEFPYLSPDGNRLYFVSQGHNSMGGYDIFYSERIGEDEWSVPINMGYPINTTDDDISYFPLGNDRALVSRVKKGSPNVRNIYKLVINPESDKIAVNIEGNLTLANNFEVVGNRFSVKLIDANTNETIQEITPEDITGKFLIASKPGSYRLVVKGDGYTKQIVPVVIPDSYSQTTYPLDIQLVPEKITSGEYLAFRSILFDFDCVVLNREAAFELEKVYGIMQKYPSLTIEVCGHTDNKGSASYNYKLSLNRAHSVIDYLVAKGINSNRLVARGASSFENIATNYNPDGTDNPEGRSLNRRASVTVLQSEDQVVLEEDLSIPEHLKPREQSYTVLLAPIFQQINPKQKDQIAKHSGFEVKKKIGHDEQFAYTIGSFNHKPQAIDLLNHAIDNGFPLATIIGEDDLRMLITLPLSVSKTSIREDQNIYTIQILAHVEAPLDTSVFKGLVVREIKGTDGMYRYIYGEYRGKNAAQEELGKVKELGFSEAFVMNINRYKE